MIADALVLSNSRSVRSDKNRLAAGHGPFPLLEAMPDIIVESRAGQGSAGEIRVIGFEVVRAAFRHADVAWIQRDAERCRHGLRHFVLNGENVTQFRS